MASLVEFIRRVRGFDALSHPEKIKLFAWHLHAYQKCERFGLPELRSCYNAVHIECGELSRNVGRLVARKPAELLKDRHGYRLSGPVRRHFDAKYGEHETVVTVSQLLRELPGKVSDEAERLFLSEALKCYKHEAFRAAIIMTWNLAFDHLLNWIVADSQRLDDFNSCIVARIGAKRGAGLVLTKREDFEELRESEVLDICGRAKLFASNNTKKVLDEQLTRRNMAAHPSLLELGRSQADDTITTLVSNVLLKLK
jgi:hypothetical protein